MWHCPIHGRTSTREVDSLLGKWVNKHSDYKPKKSEVWDMAYGLYSRDQMISRVDKGERMCIKESISRMLSNTSDLLKSLSEES